MMRAREPRDVAQEVRFAVRYPELAHRGVVRHPVPERSLASGAAELGRLLEEHDLVAEPAGEQGRGQPPAATADHDDVGLDVERRIRGRGRRRGARRDEALTHVAITPSLNWRLTDGSARRTHIGALLIVSERMNAVQPARDPVEKAGPRLRGWSRDVERMLKVLPQILGVLASDADPQEIFGDSALGGVACAALECRLDS